MNSKNMKLKKIPLFTAVVVAVLIVTALCSAVFAADSVKYTVKEGTLTFSGTGEITKELTDKIPEAVKNASKKIVIGSGITDIGNSAFYNFETVEELTLPSSVVSIGAAAFYNCRALKEVSFSSGLKTVGSYAFEKCISIEYVILPESVTTIGNGVFSGCTSLYAANLGAGVKSCPKYTFEGCTTLKNVTFGAGLTSVGKNAFKGCTSLSNIVFGGGTAGYDKITYAEGNDAVKKASVIYHGGKHNFNTLVSTTAPTCTSEGYSVYSCSCGDTKKSDIKSATGHSYTEYVGSAGDDHKTFFYCTKCKTITSEAYTPKKYTVTWSINGKKTSKTMEEGSLPTPPEFALVQEDSQGRTVEFVKWDKSIINVEKNVTYTAVFAVFEGFKETADGKKVYYENGIRLSGWQDINGKHMYFSPTDNTMQVGFSEIDGVPYFFNADGSAYTGYSYEEGGTRYYSLGAAQSGWVTSDGRKMYFSKSDYYMQTGKVSVDGTEYYFGESGSLYNGWSYDGNGISYYKDGIMLDGEQIINGREYVFENGILISGNPVDVGSMGITDVVRIFISIASLISLFMQ